MTAHEKMGQEGIKYGIADFYTYSSFFLVSLIFLSYFYGNALKDYESLKGCPSTLDISRTACLDDFRILHPFMFHVL